MKKMKKMISVLMALLMLAAAVPAVNVDAKNVTGKYKKQMNTMMEATEDYCAYLMTYNMKNGQERKLNLTPVVKMNIAAMNSDEKWTCLQSDYIVEKSILKKRVKNLFGTKAKLSKLPRNTKAKLDCFVAKDAGNAIKIRVGEWGDAWPEFKLKSIKKKGRIYTAVYNLYFCTYDGDYYGKDQIGKVTLRLKRNKKSSYGFNITGITVKRYRK